MTSKRWLVSPPIISAVLWLSFLIALARYEITYPWSSSASALQGGNPTFERSFRDIITRPELRAIVCTVLTVQIVLAIVGDLVELWLSPQRVFEGTVSAIWHPARYLLVLMSLKYDPLNHVEANNTCLGAAILLDLPAAVITMVLYWFGTDCEQRYECVAYGMHLMTVAYFAGLWAIHDGVRFMEWPLAVIWAIPHIIKARILYRLVYKPDIEFRRRTWYKFKQIPSEDEEATAFSDKSLL